MSKPVTLQDDFTAGFKRDQGRDKVPRGALWDVKDYLPGLEAGLQKRGGWEYHGPTLNSLNAGAGAPDWVAVAPFAAGTKVIALASVSGDIRVFDLTSSVDRGVLYNGQPSKVIRSVFYKDLLIFSGIPGIGGNFPFKLTSAGALSALGGSPPAATSWAIYKNFLAAANGDSIYWAVGDNPESWDTTLRKTTTSGPIRAMAALPNSMLIFHDGTVERLRGDFPPGTTASNMILEPLFGDVGIFVQSGGYSSKSFAVAGDVVVWADENGVYSSDGATISDLTRQGGISKYWREIFSGAVEVAVGVWRGFAWINLLHTTDSYRDFLLCDLRTRSWFRLSNIRAYNFATQFGATDEMYFSNRDLNSKKIGKLSGVFDPRSATILDANGVAIWPSIKTGYYNMGSQFRKRIGYAYITYGLLEANVSDNPQLETFFSTEPTDTTPEAAGLLASPLGPTDTGTSPFPNRKRARVPIRRSAAGLQFEISQAALGGGSGGSTQTILYAIEAEIDSKEGSQR